uniref:Adenylate isopentenyltransferase n=1 Tax=Setaria italica TaxID=4555 RepID=K3ZM13_SETIT
MLANKFVVIIGAMGTGKTKLSIDVAKVIGGEVINADKMQIFVGLDITTNKVSVHDRCGIAHHLIGAIHTTTQDFPVSFFRSLATATANSIVRCNLMLVIVGGSNSLIHGLLVDYFDSSLADPFALANYWPSLRFQCYFIWIHANVLVLNEYFNHRVDDMVDDGLVKELKDYFDASSNFVQQTGLGKAIGVKELGKYFMGHQSYCDTIAEMKDNTQALAKAQNAKIHHMVNVWGWPIFSLDAIETIRAHINGSDSMAKAKAWQHDVSGPALNVISEFCNNFNVLLPTVN